MIVVTAGDAVVVTRERACDPTVKVALLALVIAAGCCTVRVKLCVAWRADAVGGA